MATAAKIPVVTPRPALLARKGHSRALVLALLVAGLVGRLITLRDLPLWVDEAESAINGLTILEAGLPLDRYLGLPVFENTMVRQWPGHPEYRFKDISYSDRGVVVYHGWLPLYATAGSFRVFGIEPDKPDGSTAPRYGHRERMIRTLAARMPHVFFGLLTIVLLFLAGRTMFNVQTGLCAAALAAFWAFHIDVSQQARYYSATVMLNTLCAWRLMVTVKRRRLRDYVVGALALSALFYTHLLSFAIVSALFAGTVLITGSKREQRTQTLRRLALLASIGFALCAPWLAWTGFLRHSDLLPRACTLFVWPFDLVPRSVLLSEYFVLFALSIAVLVVSYLMARLRPAKSFHGQFQRHGPSIAILYAWLVLGYFVFLFTIPAASLFLYRMAVLLLAPATLLAAWVLSAAANTISQKRSLALTLTFALAFAVITHIVRPVPTKMRAGVSMADIDAAVDFLSSKPLAPGTRIYATPNNHLPLTFYTGLPVQSIAPVRREFLDAYPGDVVLLEHFETAIPEDSPAAAPNVVAAARSASVHIRDEDAREISWNVAIRSAQERLPWAVRRVDPAPSIVPPFAEPLSKSHAKFADAAAQTTLSKLDRSPLFRGGEIRTLHDWWTWFFYRFDQPLKHRSDPVYRSRISNSTAYFLRANWIAYHSPGARTLQGGVR